MSNNLQIADAAIAARAAQLSWIGAATNATSPQADYFFRDYVNASLYVFVKPDGTTAPVHFVIGDIRIHYKQVGGGFGYPTIDETTTPDGIGRYNFFSNNSAIYWTPATGAHAVYGNILQKWTSLGYERSPLGYPLTDETSYGTRGGRFNDFQFGSINFSPATGAYEHIGPLPDKLQNGLGFSFKAGVPVGGWTNVELHSDGTVRFRGNFHDSGAFTFDFSVANVIKDADNVAYTLAKSGVVTAGHRDYPWDQTVVNNDIRDNWRSLVSSFQLSGHANTGLDIGADVASALQLAGFVATEVEVIVSQLQQ
jgi:hypothetical protein